MHRIDARAHSRCARESARSSRACGRMRRAVHREWWRPSSHASCSSCSSSSSSSWSSTEDARRRLERLCAERWAVDGSAHGVRVALMPRRRCAGVDVHFPRELMVRYVSAVDDGGVAWVTPDAAGRLRGRGTYVSANPRAVEEAVKRKKFELGFKNKDIRGPKTLVEMTRRGLRREVVASVERAGASAAEARASDSSETARVVERETTTTVEEEIEKLLEAQKRIVADDWVLIPSDFVDEMGDGRLEKESVDCERAPSDVSPGVGYRLDVLTMDELLSILEGDSLDEIFATNVRACLERFRLSKKLSDAPVLVGVDEDVSLRLRIAQIKLKLFERG